MSKRWEYQATLPASWETCMQVKKQQLELGVEQETGSKSGTEYVKVLYCHPANLIYMQIHHAKCQLNEGQTGIKISRRNINNHRYADDTSLMAESKEELRNSWWRWKRKVKKLA